MTIHCIVGQRMHARCSLYGALASGSRRDGTGRDGTTRTDILENEKTHMPVETLLLIRGLLLFLVLSPVRRGAARGTDRPVVSVPGSVDAQARSHFHAALTGCGLFLCFKQRAFPGWHAVSFTQPGVFRLRVGGGEGVEGWYVVFVLVVLCLVLIALNIFLLSRC